MDREINTKYRGLGLSGYPAPSFYWKGQIQKGDSTIPISGKNTRVLNQCMPCGEN